MAQVINLAIDELYGTARRDDASGGKISGASAEYYMTFSFYCPVARKYVVAQPLERLGAKEVSFEEEMFEGEPYEKYYFVGWMKRFKEILCRMYGEKIRPGMTTIVLRPTNVYGPHDDFDLATSHVIPALIRKVVERWDPIEVWGTGEDAWRTWSRPWSRPQSGWRTTRPSTSAWGRGTASGRSYR